MTQHLKLFTKTNDYVLNSFDASKLLKGTDISNETKVLFIFSKIKN